MTPATSTARPVELVWLDAVWRQMLADVYGVELPEEAGDDA